VQAMPAMPTPTQSTGPPPSHLGLVLFSVLLALLASKQRQHFFPLLLVSGDIPPVFFLIWPCTLTELYEHGVLLLSERSSCWMQE